MLNRSLVTTSFLRLGRSSMAISSTVCVCNVTVKSPSISPSEATSATTAANTTRAASMYGYDHGWAPGEEPTASAAVCLVDEGRRLGGDELDRTLDPIVSFLLELAQAVTNLIIV